VEETAATVRPSVLCPHPTHAACVASASAMCVSKKPSGTAWAKQQAAREKRDRVKAMERDMKDGWAKEKEVGDVE
jgi:hypothetical protein